MANIKKIKVVDRLHDSYMWYHGGFGRYSVPVIEITLRWDGRSEPKLNRYHEDGEDFWVHNWYEENGSAISYADAIEEAENNGLNPGLKERRTQYRDWLNANGHSKHAA
jgi:hypothetical protein